MPTTKPRVTVTLDPYVHETIKRLAGLQGRSRGAVIADLVESVHPPLMRTVALLEAASEAPEGVKKGLRKAVEDAEKEVLAASSEGNRQMDLLLDRIRSEGANTPVPVTRGSGLSPGGSKSGPEGS